MQKHPEASTNQQTTSLVAHPARVPDPRINRNKDPELVDILVIAVCALLCATETFNDPEDFGKAKRDWFQTFLR
jgi:DDE_Tnp_1-associated